MCSIKPKLYQYFTRLRFWYWSPLNTVPYHWKKIIISKQYVHVSRIQFPPMIFIWCIAYLAATAIFLRFKRDNSYVYVALSTDCAGHDNPLIIDWQCTGTCFVIKKNPSSTIWIHYVINKLQQQGIIMM